MRVGTRIKVLNLVLFQLGWFACVLGAAWGQAWIGVATVAAIVTLHLYLARPPSREALLILLVGTLGFAWESWQRGAGIVSYPQASASILAPVWMLALWLNFATTLNLSLGWFQSHKLIATITAFFAGPFAYYGGMQLGAIAMPNAQLALLSIGIGWAVLFPTCLWLASRLNGFVDDSRMPVDWAPERPNV